MLISLFVASLFAVGRGQTTVGVKVYGSSTSCTGTAFLYQLNDVNRCDNLHLTGSSLLITSAAAGFSFQLFNAFECSSGSSSKPTFTNVASGTCTPFGSFRHPFHSYANGNRATNGRDLHTDELLIPNQSNSNVCLCPLNIIYCDTKWILTLVEWSVCNVYSLRSRIDGTSFDSRFDDLARMVEWSPAIH
jgi:hypothetical protein